jgi:hypothetical protein
MKQKDQTNIDSQNENMGEHSKKRAYKAPKLYVDLLKGFTTSKFHYNSYEVAITLTSRPNGTPSNIIGRTRHTPGGVVHAHEGRES